MRKLLFFIILLGCSMFANAELDLGTPGSVGINFEPVVVIETTNYTALNVTSAETWVTNEGTLDNVVDILTSWLTNDAGFISSVTNIFNQDLNTTSDVTFNNLTVTGETTLENVTTDIIHSSYSYSMVDLAKSPVATVTADGGIVTAISTPSIIIVDSTEGFPNKGFYNCGGNQMWGYYGSKNDTAFKDLRWFKTENGGYNLWYRAVNAGQAFRLTGAGFSSSTDTSVNPYQDQFVVNTNSGAFVIRKSGTVVFPYDSLLYNVRGLKSEIIDIISGYNRVTWNPGETVFNSYFHTYGTVKKDINYRFTGLVDQYLLFTDATNDRVGIGTGTPTAKLDVNGNALVREDLNVNGDVNVTHNFTGNQIYGGMWEHNHTGTAITFTTQDVFYPLWFSEAIHLNGFSYTGGFDSSSNLTAQVGGVYQATYMVIGSGENNDVYVTSILVNGVDMENCANHKKMSAGGDEVTQSGNCFIDLNIGDDVQLATMDYGGTGAGVYFGGNLNLVRIGN